MNALQDRCIAKEGVIGRLRKRNKTLTNKHEQYKEVVHSLNEEVMALKEKLKEEACLREKAEDKKASVEKELTTLFEQLEVARTDAIMEYKASQPFIDACTVYYGDGFDDYLKQLWSVYLDLDLFRVTMDDPLSTTPTASDATNKEPDKSTYVE